MQTNVKELSGEKKKTNTTLLRKYLYKKWTDKIVGTVMLQVSHSHREDKTQIALDSPSSHPDFADFSHNSTCLG